MKQSHLRTLSLVALAASSMLFTGVASANPQTITVYESLQGLPDGFKSPLYLETCFKPSGFFENYVGHCTDTLSTNHAEISTKTVTYKTPQKFKFVFRHNFDALIKFSIASNCPANMTDCNDQQCATTEYVNLPNPTLHVNFTYAGVQDNTTLLNVTCS